MGLWSCLPALLAVWTLVSPHPTALIRHQLQPAASSHDGTTLARLRRSRTARTGGGSTSRFLKVGPVPPPASDTVGLLDSLVIQCEFQGAPPPVIDWLRDGRVIQTTSLAGSLEERTNSLDVLASASTPPIVATHARLFLDCMTASDQGVYTCRGQTPFETKTISTSLFVVEPLTVEGATECERAKDMDVSPARIVQWRSHIFAQMGSPVRLVCESSGLPAPLITWYKDDRTLSTADPRITLMPNGDLVIESLKWTDMGLYRCQAANELGTDAVTTFLYPLKPEN